MQPRHHLVVWNGNVEGSNGGVLMTSLLPRFASHRDVASEPIRTVRPDGESPPKAGLGSTSAESRRNSGTSAPSLHHQHARADLVREHV
jgi:hypothetical protein